MNKISNFPIMFFAVIMGLGGLNIAYEKLNSVLDISQIIFDILRILTSGIFVVICGIYLMKMLKFNQNVRSEFTNVDKIDFFAAIPISLLLLAILWSDTPILHDLLFYSGTAILTFMTFYVISFWINKNIEIKHSNPAWFIPIVGNSIVIIAAERVEAWLWYYFSVAIFFYFILFGIIFYRILFHDQLASKFMPTLFIMIAPPAIGFLDVVKLEGFNSFAVILLNLAIFFGLLVIFMYKNFLKLKFFLSWWAFIFPTAALSIACLKAYEITQDAFFLYLGEFIFVLLCVMTAFISYHTLKNIKNGSIFAPEI